MAILVGAAAKCLWARWLAGGMFRGGGMLCSAIQPRPRTRATLGPSLSLLESVYGSINPPQL